MVLKSLDMIFNLTPKFKSNNFLSTLCYYSSTFIYLFFVAYFISYDKTAVSKQLFLLNFYIQSENNIFGFSFLFITKFVNYIINTDYYYYVFLHFFLRLNLITELSILEKGKFFKLVSIPYIFIKIFFNLPLSLFLCHTKFIL